MGPLLAASSKLKGCAVSSHRHNRLSTSYPQYKPSLIGLQSSGLRIILYLSEALTPTCREHGGQSGQKIASKISKSTWGAGTLYYSGEAVVGFSQ